MRKKGKINGREDGQQTVLKVKCNKDIKQNRSEPKLTKKTEMNCREIKCNKKQCKCEK